MGNKLINDLTADCQAGSISACVKLAYEYTVGKNVPKDLIKAFQLYEIASQADNLTALFNLAQFYLNGIKDSESNVVVAKNSKLAIDLLAKSASLGCLESHYFLGLEYQKNENLNLQLAKSHLEYCASHNMGKAQYELGLYYLNIENNRDLANKWFAKAKGNGIINA